MNSRERFLAACRYQAVDRPPVWLMRQAGRYLPEYRALRQERSFWDMVRSPELATEVTLQPIRRFHMDAAILFSDILTIPDTIGAEVRFEEGAGPVIDQPIRSAADLDRLKVFEAARDVPYVGETIRRLAAKLHPETALIGFAGAPLTLAAYMVEGGSSRDLRELKTLAYRDPDLVHRLLDLLADAAANLLSYQVAAGADAVQLFDSWAGLLSPEDYAELALPYELKVVQKVQALDVPVLLYMRGSAGLLEAAASTGCDVLSVDQTLPIAEARKRLNGDVALQGNLDPVELLGPLDRIKRRVKHLIDGTGGQGHIVNLGQGVIPPTPPEAVGAFVEAVQGWSA